VAACRNNVVLSGNLVNVGVLDQVYRACVSVSNDAYAQELLKLAKAFQIIMLIKLLLKLIVKMLV
jgi:hypothetical protein